MIGGSDLRADQLADMNHDELKRQTRAARMARRLERIAGMSYAAFLWLQVADGTPLGRH